MQYEVWADTSGYVWVVLDPGNGLAPVRLSAAAVEVLGVTLDEHTSIPSVQSVGIGVGSGSLSVDLRQEWPLVSAGLTVGIAAAAVLVTFITARSRRRAATLRAVAVHEASSREAERTRIAREIHDGPLQELALLARSDCPVGVRHGIQSVSADLRALAADLRPPALDRLGLAAALEDLADYWAEASVSLSVRVDDGDVGRLADGVELALYRIAQEALANASEHGQARTAWVFLRAPAADREPLARARRGIEFIVRDDGVGIPLAFASGTTSEQRLVAGGHFGLIGMSERARMLGASLVIGRGPGGHGTEVRISVPPS